MRRRKSRYGKRKEWNEGRARKWLFQQESWVFGAVATKEDIVILKCIDIFLYPKCGHDLMTRIYVDSYSGIPSQMFG